MMPHLKEIHNRIISEGTIEFSLRILPDGVVVNDTVKVLYDPVSRGYMYHSYRADPSAAPSDVLVFSITRTEHEESGWSGKTRGG